ncbi:flippase [Bradyrhizobium sp.]|uniref:flippase n=1 Tax=Bradyrhizobium sp. TaxID=376 RepID=UPI0027341864|nr:flippase [Bradyrhizobium sp.]MDP3075378.1 flippase [Bradyrhizobium sp.]
MFQRVRQNFGFRRRNSRLFFNLFWSFLGTGLPALVAIVTIPPLIHQMGLPRFGVLSLAWIVVGYFSFFDLGLGRAMTQLVAQKIGMGDESEIPSIVWIGTALMICLGVVGAIVLASISPWLVGTKLQLPPDLREETLSAFYLLASSIPIVIVSTGLRGILEAFQRFDLVNLVKIPMGIITYLAPLAVLPYSAQLPMIVAALVVARFIACGVYFVVCYRVFPQLARAPAFHVHHIRQMLSFGGWMTLSNIVGPLLMYLGRMALAVYVSVEAVAYFSAPYDVVINLLIVPATFVSVYFPLFTRDSMTSLAAVRGHYRQALSYNLVLMLPLAAVTFVFAKPALSLWIDPDFAEKSYWVAQLLAIGVLINSIGLISQSLVQALGRPDLTAKLHVLELVAYIPYLWWLIGTQGVNGAAMAWVIRVAISTACLLVMASVCMSADFRKSDSKKDPGS